MLSLIIEPQFVLVSMFPRKKHPQIIQSEVDEAIALIENYGGKVIKHITQSDTHLHGGTYIGKGKAEEVSQFIDENNVDVVVINENLSSSQRHNLKKIFTLNDIGIVVWDRTDLILQIFKQHANTSEAKLQIKLAEIKHRGPELQGMGAGMSQQGAGIGTVGLGETNTEIMKRHWRTEMKRIQDELKELAQGRFKQMEHRKRLRLPTISIVGYTNAGKSTLFNLLTKKNNFVKDMPFATLDSSVGKLYLHGLRKEAFLTDTIGFIQNLPTKLVEAFESTLMETINADVLLHVIDLSDPFFYEKIDTVEQVLSDLNLKDKKQIYVFNKVDNEKIENKEELIEDLSRQFAEYSPQYISATKGTGVEGLIAMIEEKLLA